MSGSTKPLAELSTPAQKLLTVIAQQADHGTLRSKAPGVATLPEVHEACGLDPEPMQVLLKELSDAGWLRIEGEYPFEELRPLGSKAELAGLSLELDSDVYEAIQEGLNDVALGRTRPAKEAFEQIRRKCGIPRD
jgi:hypothetical protein